ncbi:hypothetical protein QVD17_10867 [Tagetes erecta]|uniref:Uncharacterized protein n=1 Tax=Tagetes erecta TaxID=13708 RepID=A0AAD8L202_TARER|nr:hypothetical protein QVD17_10867 [Tagetes erecta]
MNKRQLRKILIISQSDDLVKIKYWVGSKWLYEPEGATGPVNLLSTMDVPFFRRFIALPTINRQVGT